LAGAVVLGLHPRNILGDMFSKCPTVELAPEPGLVSECDGVDLSSAVPAEKTLNYAEPAGTNYR
jgi:hypothetical protein